MGRRHTARSTDGDPVLDGYLGRSACGKIAYTSRKAAKARRHQGSKLHAYLCPHCSPGTWHLGHHPRSVKRGDVSSADAYGA